MIRNILIYLVIVNIAAFFLYGIDKSRAKAGRYRISEKALLLIAVIGGSVGALAGMWIFHHKTKKKKFSIGVPAILCLQLFLAWLFIFVLYQPLYK